MTSRSHTHRSQGSHYARFVRRLRAAMGLGSAAGLFVSIAACGGKVVIDQPSSEGSGGASSSGGEGGQTSSASGTPGYDCDVEAPTGYIEEYGCLPLGGPNNCPDKSTAEVMKALSETLNSTACDPDGACCTQAFVVSVVCGPDPTVQQCCYTALLATSTICEGRPFTVHGEARTAALARRADWKATLSPDLNGLDEEARRELADAWGRDALAEHASIASFARFALELLAVGAPADLVAGAHKAMGDEIRHAELCFALASAYAGKAVGPARLRIEDALAGRSDPAEVAAAVVREGCMGETVAALIAAASRDAAEDEAVKSALSSIAPDEEAHAALAWRYVAWALRNGEHRVRAAIEEAFASAQASLGTASVASVSRAEAEELALALTFTDRSSALRAHGRLSEASQRDVMERALREVIRPCASAMLLECVGPTQPEAEARA